MVIPTMNLQVLCRKTALLIWKKEILSRPPSRRKLLKQAEQALEEKEAAIKAAKQAKKKAQSKKSTTNGSGDNDDDASEFPPQSCPHCAFIKMKTPHPEHITPDTCHTNPVNIKKAPKFILKKYIKALGEADE